jgi:hypothetical protein
MIEGHRPCLDGYAMNWQLDPRCRRRPDFEASERRPWSRPDLRGKARQRRPGSQTASRPLIPRSRKSALRPNIDHAQCRCEATSHLPARHGIVVRTRRSSGRLIHFDPCIWGSRPPSGDGGPALCPSGLECRHDRASRRAGRGRARHGTSCSSASRRRPPPRPNPSRRDVMPSLFLAGLNFFASPIC